VTGVVAIDGPAGSGKSTVARSVAARLGLDVLDTGAMYRAVTLLALDRALDLDDGDTIARVAATVPLVVGEPPGTVRLAETDVSAEIRTPRVSAAVSQVSSHPAVRQLLRAAQREWAARHGGGVVEGRDIGTVVFPDAAVKVFLTASDAERAARRHRDEDAAARPTALDAVQEAVSRRDQLDHRTTPLVPTEGSLVIDTTDRSVEEVTDEIVAAFTAATGASR
jgi:CMP/dCMP kinase